MNHRGVALFCIILLLMVGTASAAKTNATLVSGNVTFSSNDGKFSASTLTYVNGTISISPSVRNDNGTLIWNVSSNQVSFRYNYKNDVLKETIILTRAKVLKFNIRPKTGTVLIPWFNGQYKIVNSSLSDTMTGLVISAPTGYDAKGYNIPMRYVQEKNNLTLNYDIKISISNASYVYPVNKSDINWSLTTVNVSITYPITIDPTWTYVTDHYETTDGSYTVAKYNTTGTVNWTAPTGVTSVQYLVLAGGGSGGGGASYSGGGGAGGLLTCATYPVTAGNNYSVIVGAGGTVVNNGSNSSFNTIVANGGGYGAVNYDGGNGGSGGGGGISAGNVGGTAVPSGQGNNGGSGVNGASASGGAGGGASAAGANGVANSNGATGGAGTSSSITGESICYAGGGGGGVESSAYNGGTATCGGGQGAKGTSGGSTSGTDGLGGGGGGGTTATGGSGIVIIRYLTGGAPPDTTPPASITGLGNITTCQNITWQWTNPTDADFNHTMVWKNNVFQYNLSNVTTSDLWESLVENTAYTFSSKTVDITGNVNATFVNLTSTTDTCPVPTTEPTTTATTAPPTTTTASPTPTPTPTPLAGCTYFNLTGVTFGENSTDWNITEGLNTWGITTFNATQGNVSWWICRATPTTTVPPIWQPLINPSTDIKTDWLKLLWSWLWLPILILVMILLFRRQ